MIVKDTLKSTIVVFMAMFVLFSGLNTASAAGELGLEAESAILVDAKTGKILYEKQADLTLAPASMTKMMTEYLVLEAIENGTISWDQDTAISEYAYKISQNRSLSNVPLRSDGMYKVKELYEAMAIYSANGATIALAELVGGSEKNFVKMMNDKAEEMNLGEHQFLNTTGLNNSDLQGMHHTGGENEENLLTARGTAKLAYYLVKDYPEVLETASIPKKIFREGTDDAINMSNWNWMLPDLVYGYEGMDGLKTGSTDLAGYSFTGTAVRDGMRLISVVMKTESYKSRFEETQKLMDYGFGQFEEKELYPASFQVKGMSELPVIKGKEETVEIATDKAITTVIKTNEEELYSVKYNLDKGSLTEDGELTAKVKKGQKVGALNLIYKGEMDLGYIEDGKDKKVESVDLVTTTSVEKSNWFVLFFSGIGDFFAEIFTSVVDAVKGIF
ncbi:D-alanyl-D-alanine carboxypeptidase family protein (plasmid) [Rossellomorea sp. AcN35-11]|nr:D-alanyl-D-alanine carboxypeptidase [Rossellomorea aquimaris]WJV32089.1 D-alanyl-D-alanine carboxypeptidase family protein [Rossellomorea sp. AcN35-11]